MAHFAIPTAPIFYVRAIAVVLGFGNQAASQKPALLKNYPTVYSDSYPVQSKPDIIFRVMKGQLNNTLIQLEYQGFSLYSIILVEETGEHILSVGLTPRLLLKLLAIYSKTPIMGNLSELKPAKRYRLAEKAIHIMERSCPSISYASLLRDKFDFSSYFKMGDREQQYHSLSDFFGTKVALLALWLSLLKSPYMLGTLLWIGTLVSNQKWAEPVLGIALVLFMNYMNCVTRFVAGDVARSWDKIRDSDDPQMLEVTLHHDKFLENTRLRGVVKSVLGMAACVAAQILLTIFLSRDAADSASATNFLLVIIYYALSLSFVTYAEHSFVPKFVAFEAHLTETRKFESRVTKIVVLHLSVFLSRLLLLLVRGSSLHVIHGEMSFLFSLYVFTSRSFPTILGVPRVTAVKPKVGLGQGYKRIELPTDGSGAGVTNLKLPVNLRQRSTSSTGSKNADASDDLLNVRVAQELTKEDIQLIEESQLPAFDADSHYLDCVTISSIAYSLVAIAPVILPLSAYLLARRSGVHIFNKLAFSRRPAVNDEMFQMDVWQRLLHSTGVIGLVVNIGMLYLFCCNPAIDDADAARRASLRSFLGFTDFSDEKVAITLLVVEHVALALVFLFFEWAISVFDGQRRVAILAYERFTEFKENVYHRLRKLNRSLAYATGVGAVETKFLSDSFESKLKLAEMQGKVGKALTPYFICVLALVPYILSSVLSFPWWTTFPPFFLLVGYIDSTELRRKRLAAMSMVSEPAVLDLLIQSIPGSFIYDSELERCDWVNSGLKLSWNGLVMYGTKKIRAAIEPKLESSVPSFAKSLSLLKLSLGSVPPKITRVRVLKQMKPDEVDVDVDFEWNSNLEMYISLVFLTGGEMNIGVSNFKFAGSARLHFLKVIPAIPPFEIAQLTFFDKPTVDFALNINKTDSDEHSTQSSGNIASIIASTIKHILQTMVIYPKWMNVKMVNPKPGEPITPDPEPFTLSPPEGVLCVRLLGCSDLLDSSSTYSPFVTLNMLDEEQRSESASYLSRQANPSWEDANFNFLVHEKKTQNLFVEVWGETPFVTGNVFLGKAAIPIKRLPEGLPESKTVPLQGVPHGSIVLEISYNGLHDDKSAETKSFAEASLTDLLLANAEDTNAFIVADTAGFAVEKISCGHKNTEADIASGMLNSLPVTSSPVSSPVVVAGVLSLSDLIVNGLASVKGFVTSEQSMPCLIEVNMGNKRMSTSLSAKNKVDAHFKETFHFVVSSPEKDQITVRLKTPGAIQGHNVLAECVYKVADVLVWNNLKNVSVDLSSQEPTIKGELSLKLLYRPSKMALGI